LEISDVQVDYFKKHYFSKLCNDFLDLFYALFGGIKMFESPLDSIKESKLESFIENYF